MLFNRPEFEIKPETFINRSGNLEINIDMVDFMKDQLSKEENPNELLQEYVSVIDQAIKKTNLDFPWPSFSKDVLMYDFDNLVKSQQQFETVNWSSEKANGSAFMQYKGESLIFPIKSAGQKILQQFMDKYRLKCTHTRFPNSTYSLWEKETYWLKPFLTEFNLPINEKTLIKGIDRRKNEPKFFRPLCAKAIINMFGAKSVLDFSAGWGGRLLGFHASNAESYIGVDPNSKLHYPYQQINNFCNTGKDTKFLCAPSEEVEYANVNADLVFTAPPYIDWNYSDDETQSFNRYLSKDQWLNEYLYPSLQKAWNVLDSGGRMVICLEDFYSKDKDKIKPVSQYKNICSPMSEFMLGLGATPEGVLGYSLPTRRKRQGNLLHGTPMFVFSKGKAPDPKFLGFEPGLFDL